MPNVIGIKFRGMGKTYYFNPKDINFAVNDKAIVETAHGIEYCIVTLANTEVADSEIKGELKNVVRKATEKDDEHYKAICDKRLPSIREAQQIADRRKLEMKFVDAEFSFDNGRAMFYFTADGRIDFRELVKEMAAHFRMRIELRQIGIREECRMKGGLGPCGRVCCCKSYLDDFARVSIKMAKVQGLSLNPSKISGLCGRLMCCLKFENDYYSQTAKFMPKANADITTPLGKGTVMEVDMLRQLVTARITKSDDETEIHQFTLAELGITPVYTNTVFDSNSDDETESDDAIPDESDVVPDDVE